MTLDPTSSVADPTLYYFTKWDRTAGTTVKSRRPATLEGIAQLGGEALMDTGAQTKSRYVNVQGFLDLAPPVFISTDCVIFSGPSGQWELFKVCQIGEDEPRPAEYFRSMEEAVKRATEIAKPLGGAIWYDHREQATLVASFHEES